MMEQRDRCLITGAAVVAPPDDSRFFAAPPRWLMPTGQTLALLVRIIRRGIKHQSTGISLKEGHRRRTQA